MMEFVGRGTSDEKRGVGTRVDGGRDYAEEAVTRKLSKGQRGDCDEENFLNVKSSSTRRVFGSIVQ